MQTIPTVVTTTPWVKKRAATMITRLGHRGKGHMFLLYRHGKDNSQGDMTQGETVMPWYRGSLQSPTCARSAQVDSKLEQGNFVFCPRTPAASKRNSFVELTATEDGEGPWQGWLEKEIGQRWAYEWLLDMMEPPCPEVVGIWIPGVGAGNSGGGLLASCLVFGFPGSIWFP